MSKDLLIMILCFGMIYLFYEINNLKKEKIENFDAISDATNIAITNAVKEIYSVDIESIRALSNFAIELSKGGKTIPGNLGITGKFNMNRTAIDEYQLNGIGRYHISTGELLYLLPKDGVIIGKEWGGNGNLSVQGNAKINGELYGNTITTNDKINCNNGANNTYMKHGKIESTETIHMFSPSNVYLAPKDKVVVGKLAGGSGNLLVESDLTVGTNDDPNKKGNIIAKGIIYGEKGIDILGPGGDGWAKQYNGIYPGNDNNATKTNYNVEIRSWDGIGIKDTCFNKTNIWFDARTGTINCKVINIVDDNGNIKKTINN